MPTIKATSHHSNAIKCKSTIMHGSTLAISQQFKMLHLNPTNFLNWIAVKYKSRRILLRDDEVEQAIASTSWAFSLPLWQRANTGNSVRLFAEGGKLS